MKTVVDDYNVNYEVNYYVLVIGYHSLILNSLFYLINNK